MKIRKGDILYQCNSIDISAKDYCNNELLKRLSDQGLDCSLDDFNHGVWLNTVITNVEKGTPGYFYKRKRRNLKSYISLRDRVKDNLNGG